MKKSVQDSDEVILLADLLTSLEKHFDVTFLYKEEIVRNKMVRSGKIRMDKQAGRDLSRILHELGLSFQRIDKQTYVLVKKTAFQRAPVMEQVSGQVVDAPSGDPMPGVNIAVKGTNIGTSTNPDGRFQLAVPSLSDTLVVSLSGIPPNRYRLTGELI